MNYVPAETQPSAPEYARCEKCGGKLARWIAPGQLAVEVRTRAGSMHRSWPTTPWTVQCACGKTQTVR